MKHASQATLAQLSEVLSALRALPQLRERTPGAFYCQSQACLHFHEDPTGVFDVKLDKKSFERLPVNTASEQRMLLAAVKQSLVST